MKLYVDDLRSAPDGWERAYTAEEAIERLEEEDCEVLDLDGHLGDGQPGGIYILQWIKRKMKEEGFNPPELRTHSGLLWLNDRMQDLIAEIEEIRPKPPGF